MGSGVTCFDQLFITSKPNFWPDKGPDLFRISFLGATGPKISTFLPKTTLQMELWPLQTQKSLHFNRFRDTWPKTWSVKEGPDHPEYNTFLPLDHYLPYPVSLLSMLCAPPFLISLCPNLLVSGAACRHHTWWVYSYHMTVPDPHPSRSRPLVWRYGFMWNGHKVDSWRWHMIGYMELCKMKLWARSTNICWFLLMNPLHLVHERRMVDGCDQVWVAGEYLSLFSNPGSNKVSNFTDKIQIQ